MRGTRTPTTTVQPRPIRRNGSLRRVSATPPRARPRRSARNPAPPRPGPACRYPGVGCPASSEMGGWIVAGPRRRSRPGLSPHPTRAPRGAMDGGGELNGFLDPCLLLLLREHPDHGYNLLGRLQELRLAGGEAARVYRALRAL